MNKADRLEPEQLDQLRLPAILHWDLNHFVVLKSVDARGAVGLATIPLGETIGIRRAELGSDLLLIGAAELPFARLFADPLPG